MDLRADRCANCALGVDAWASEVLELLDGLPEMVRPDDCLLCGLYAEVCPTGALGGPWWPVIDWPLCTDCSLCLDICPFQVFALEGEEVVVANARACNGCGECVDICPPGAVEITSERGKEEWRRPRPDSTRKW